MPEECTVSCGGGTRQCEKFCQNGNLGDIGCEVDNSTIVEECNVQPCRKKDLFYEN